MSVVLDNQTNFIKFLGTAGARFVMIKQLRASGGIWVSCSGVNVLIDPGPGSLVRCLSSRPKLNPALLDGLILTHRHLDHSNDINVMIEAMTDGGFKKRGVVFCPQDALSKDAVVFSYIRKMPQEITILRPRSKYNIGKFSFKTSMQHIHPAQTYGLKFKIKNTTVALLSDTKYFKDLIKFYKSDILIVCVAFVQPRRGVDHLCLADAKELIRRIKPKIAILTHFGMTMLAAKPHLLAESLTEELGIEVKAAYDGMQLDSQTLEAR